MEKILNLSFLYFGIIIQLTYGQFGQLGQNPIGLQSAVQHCNNGACSFVCTHNSPCVGMYVCGSQASSCSFSCSDNDACSDAIFVTLTRNTQFNCLGDNGCHGTKMYCGRIPQSMSALFATQSMSPGIFGTTAANLRQQTCNFYCRGNACNEIDVQCLGVNKCEIHTETMGTNNALESSRIVCDLSNATSTCNLHCGGTMNDPQCKRVHLQCGKGQCLCHGVCFSVTGVSGGLRPNRYPQIPHPYRPQIPQVPQPYRPQIPQVPVKQIPQIPYNLRRQQFPFPINQVSSSIQCDQSPYLCANRVVTCVEEACVFECFEPRSCFNTTFVSSPITLTLEVICKKRDACRNLKVLSNAQTTKIQCDDHSCIGVHVFCNPFMGQLCEMSCQNDGCVPLAHNNYPMRNIYTNHKSIANSMICKGNIVECNLKVQNERAFIGGKFFCGVTTGRCLMECADAVGEVSCRGASYRCATNPFQCQCHDQVRGNVLFHAPVGRRGDCPKITFPTKAPSKSPTKKPKTKIH